MSEAHAIVEQAPTELTLVVSGNPLSQNRAWTIITWKPKPGSTMAPHGSLKITKEGIEYKLEIARAAASARPPSWDRENEYVVELVHYFSSRRPDHDGPGKLIFDALGDFEIKQGRRVYSFTGLYKNDRQIWKSSQQKELDPVSPRTEIRIKLRWPPRSPAPQQGALL